MPRCTHSRPARETIFTGEWKAVRNRHARQIASRGGMCAPSRLEPIEAAFQLLFNGPSIRIGSFSQVLHHVNDRDRLGSKLGGGRMHRIVVGPIKPEGNPAAAVRAGRVSRHAALMGTQLVTHLAEEAWR